MSSKTPVGYIDIRVFAHATEEEDRVLKAARNILPPETANAVNFNKTNLTGYHGNPIILFDARIKDKNLAKAVFAKLCSGLSLLDKETLGSEIRDHLDKGNLYIRLDKQSAYLNEMRLGSTDPIHLRMHFKKHGDEEVLDVCRESGLIP